MHIKWLEDFITLAQTRSFSRAAELRHVTPPPHSGGASGRWRPGPAHRWWSGVAARCG